VSQVLLSKTTNLELKHVAPRTTSSPLPRPAWLLQRFLALYPRAIYTFIYDFQIDHAPDDGSTASQITPILDWVLALLLIPRSTRLPSTTIATTFFIIGLTMQFSAGKGYGWDVALVALGLAGMGAAWLR
jgi:hypothetical protein